jgi:lysophospholipase L1-like esterase
MNTTFFKKIGLVTLGLILVLSLFLFKFEVSAPGKLTVSVGDPVNAAGIIPDVAGTTSTAVQAALDMVAVTGGQIELLSSAYTFTSTVLRAIPNVTFKLNGATITNNGSTPLFSAGSQSGWSFYDGKLDAGGITLTSATNYSIVNIWFGTTYYSHKTDQTLYGNLTGIASNATSATNQSGGTVNATSLTDSGLTSGRIPYSSTGGLLTDESAFTYDTATNTLKADNLTAPTGRTATYVIAASNATATEKAQADVVCDGTADDVQWQAGLDAGYKHIRGTSGTYTFATTVLKAVNDVIIESSMATFNYDSLTPLFSSGSQTGWTFRDLKTDAGGILGGCTLENVTLGTVYCYSIKGASGTVKANQGSLIVASAAGASSQILDRRFENRIVYVAGLWWVFYSDGTAVSYRSSANNGVSWSTATSVFAGTAGTVGYCWAICTDGTRIFYCKTDPDTGHTLTFRAGTAGTNGVITWLSAELVVDNSATVSNFQPNIQIDSTGLPVITYRRTSGGNSLPYAVRKSNNTWTGWSNDTALNGTDGYKALNATACTTGTWWTSVIPLSGGQLYFVCGKASAGLIGALYDGAGTWTSENTAIAALYPNYTADLSVCVDAADNIFVAFLSYTTYQNQYVVKRTFLTSTWETPVVTKTYFTYLQSCIGYDATSGNLMLVYGDSDNFIYKAISTDSGLTWCVSSCVSEPTDGLALYDRGVAFSMSYQQQNGYFGVMYLTKATAPFNIKFLAVNARVKSTPAIVFTGDSILAQYPPKYFVGLTGQSYVNTAIGGEVTANVAARRVRDILNHYPEYLYICTGVNDISGSVAFDTFIANYIIILNACYLATPQIKVKLIPILPHQSNSTATNQLADRWNLALEALSRSYTNVTFCDIRPAVGVFQVGGDAGNLWNWKGVVWGIAGGTNQATVVMTGGGGTIVNGSGTVAEAGAIPVGTSTIHITGTGSFSITMADGVTATITSVGGGATITGSPAVLDSTPCYSSDGLHPTAIGGLVMANALLRY